VLVAALGGVQGSLMSMADAQRRTVLVLLTSMLGFKPVQAGAPGRTTSRGEASARLRQYELSTAPAHASARPDSLRGGRKIRTTGLRTSLRGRSHFPVVLKD